MRSSETGRYRVLTYNDRLQGIAYGDFRRGTWRALR